MSAPVAIWIIIALAGVFGLAYVFDLGSKAQGWIGLLLAPMLLFTLALSYHFGGSSARWILVNVAGVPIDATVLARYRTVGEGIYYDISYTYDIAGNTYTATQGVGPNTYDRLGEGSRVVVRYLTFSPSTSLLAGKDADSSYLFEETLGFILSAVGAAFIGVRGVRILRKRLRKLTEA